MKTLSKLVSTSSVSLLVITSPVLISSNHKKIEVSTSTAVVAATYHIPVLTNSSFKNFTYTSPAVNAAAAEKLAAVDKAPDFNASAEVKKAFEDQGLDANDYGIFCSDTFIDESKNEKTLLGIRYDELFSFILSSI